MDLQIHISDNYKPEQIFDIFHSAKEKHLDNLGKGNEQHSHQEQLDYHMRYNSLVYKTFL